LVTLNPKYKRIGSDAKFSIVTGGRGSGKSFALTYLICLLSYEKGHTILYTRYTLRAAHISIIPEFLQKIELMNKLADFEITKDSIINKVTGSRILFRGIKTSSGDQTANLKSIQGLSTWVLDEAEELTDENKFDTINLSVREDGVDNRVILIMNPTTKEHWVYKKFFEQRGVKEGTNDTIDDVNYIHTTYLDNIDNLSPSFIKDVERLKDVNPTKYKHKILGGWLDKAEGVVFENWEFGEFNPNNLQTSFGMDFGFSVDPDTLIETAIDKKKKVIYVKQHIYKKGLQLEPLARLTKQKASNKLIIADSAEPRLISDLKSKGLNIKAVKKGTIESGITLMLDYKIIVDKDSTDIAKEFNNYTYLDKGSKMYIDDWNHGIDSIRYNVTYQLQNPNKGKYFVY
jgi:phage terminase large subunit